MLTTAACCELGAGALLGLAILSALLLLVLVHRRRRSAASTEAFRPTRGANAYTTKRDPPDVVHVYWSGGVLSTHRILRLLLADRRRVRPVFRWVGGTSVAAANVLGELRAIRHLRRVLREQHPAQAPQLLDTRFVLYAEQGAPRATRVAECARIRRDLRAREPTTPFLWNLMHTSTSVDEGRTVELVVPYHDADDPSEERPSQLVRLARTPRVAESVLRGDNRGGNDGGYPWARSDDPYVVDVRRFKARAALARHFGNIRFVFVRRRDVLRDTSAHAVLAHCASCKRRRTGHCGECARCVENRRAGLQLRLEDDERAA